jgi:hypothetical protein
MAKNFEKLIFGGLHEKHAVQRGIWTGTGLCFFTHYVTSTPTVERTPRPTVLPLQRVCPLSRQPVYRSVASNDRLFLL